MNDNIANEVPLVVVCQEDNGEANHSDIGPCDCEAVSSKQTQSLDGINSPFQAKDSIISVHIAHLNFKALLDTGAAVTAISACESQESVSDVSPNLDLPNRDSITKMDGYSLQIFGKMMLRLAVG